MLFEIGTSLLFGGIAASAFVAQKGVTVNDSGKIQRIMSLSGLNVKDGKDTLTTQLLTKKQYDWGWEYKYRIPLGRSFNDYLAKQDVIQDGLNNKKKILTLNDIKQIPMNKEFFTNLREMQERKLGEQKEVELAYDGLLKIRVYDKSLPNQINWDESLIKPNKWTVPIGYTRNGETIWHDFDKFKHLIVAGATGYGKSVILKLIVSSLIAQQPENAELSLFDLKGGSAFHRFKDCKQVKYYARNPIEVAEMLQKVQSDMEKAFENVVDNGFEDVKEAKIKKRHFIIIDEAADLAEDKKAKSIITDIARRGRSAGYYLIICTQYPTAAVLDSQVKRNIIARLCYVVDTDTASRVVLDEGGADKLPAIPGRGIYKNGVTRYTIQSPFISNETINQLILPHIQNKVVRNDREEKVNEPRRTNLVSFEEI